MFAVWLYGFRSFLPVPLTVSYGIGVEDLKVYFCSSIVPSMDYLVLSKKAYV
jgi:hypothetical protein